MGSERLSVAVRRFITTVSLPSSSMLRGMLTLSVSASVFTSPASFTLAYTLLYSGQSNVVQAPNVITAAAASVYRLILRISMSSLSDSRCGSAMSG